MVISQYRLLLLWQNEGSLNCLTSVGTTVGTSVGTVPTEQSLKLLFLSYLPICEVGLTSLEMLPLPQEAHPSYDLILILLFNSVEYLVFSDTSLPQKF